MAKYYFSLVYKEAPIPLRTLCASLEAIDCLYYFHLFVQYPEWAKTPDRWEKFLSRPSEAVLRSGDILTITELSLAPGLSSTAKGKGEGAKGPSDDYRKAEKEVIERIKEEQLHKKPEPEQNKIIKQLVPAIFEESLKMIPEEMRSKVINDLENAVKNHLPLEDVEIAVSDQI